MGFRIDCVSIKLLPPMKTLLRCLAALSFVAVFCSCIQEERSPEEFLVPSLAKVDCSESTFKLSSSVPSGSEKLIYDCGFYLGTSKEMTDARQLEGKLTDASGPVPLQVTTEDNLATLKANLVSPLSASELEHLLVCMRRMLFMTHKYREEGDLEWLL